MTERTDNTSNTSKLPPVHGAYGLAYKDCRTVEIRVQIPKNAKLQVCRCYATSRPIISIILKNYLKNS